MSMYLAKENETSDLDECVSIKNETSPRLCLLFHEKGDVLATKENGNQFPSSVDESVRKDQFGMEV